MYVAFDSFFKVRPIAKTLKPKLEKFDLTTTDIDTVV